MRNGLLIKYGEIAIKGNNRWSFEHLLMDNIKERLRPVGPFTVTKEQGRVLIEPSGDVSAEAAIEPLTRLFGVVGVCPAVIFTDDSMDSIYANTLDFLKESYGTDSRHTFKIEVRRSNKRYPLNSIEIASMVGEQVLNAFSDWTVDVHQPEIKVFVELRNRVYVYAQTIPGPGGMPVSPDNRAVVLLSGGIDSPVAGWMIAKRGVELVGVYFHAHPYTSDRAKEKVVELARRMSFYGGRMKLYVVPFTDIEEKLDLTCPRDEITILMRRFMMRIAEKIAEAENCIALITGENLGQVASQTLQSLVCTNAVCKLPVFRPLIGFDKQEIIDLAKKIDTYETSILPYQDCCTIFVAKHPVTKPKLSGIERSEALLGDMEADMKDAIDRSEIYYLNAGHVVQPETAR
ncbi:MAG: tRNA 4-thiouridine(8) synthase ThiI [Firmicutes bacterium]|nr:tRNA 4-thiouridine(8) synthase ThiI [Bacillota bacterium]